MKEAHLVLLFDGTGLSATRGTPSNCKKIYDCIVHVPPAVDTLQHPIYYDGIGTSERTWVGRALSQARGYGANEKLFNAYHDVCDFAAAHPDTSLKISICGFSRGFVIGLVLEKMIHKAGILDFQKIAHSQQRETLSDKDKEELIRQTYKDIYLSQKKPGHPDIEAFRSVNSFAAPPEFHLFAFDPVTAFSKHKNYKPFNYVLDDIGEEHKLHGTKLPRGTKSYTELIALDEKRGSYDVLPVTFPDHYRIDHTRILCAGDHSCIGGGCAIREGLADIAGLEMLKHMYHKAGVRIDVPAMERLFTPDPHVDVNVRELMRRHFLYAVTVLTSPHEKRQLNVGDEGASIHPTVFLRSGYEEGLSP